MSQASVMASLVLLSLFFSRAQAQAQVESLNDQTLTVRMGVQLPSIPLKIESTKNSNDGTTLDYEQNASAKFGLGFDWGYWGGYLSFLNLQPGEDENDFGKTDYFDLQFHFFVQNWGFDLVWQDFKGYYLKNTADVLPAYYASNGNLIREDIESFFAGVNLIYVFHPERISYSAALAGTAIQTGSGGSWSLLSGYSDQKLDSDGTLAPDDLAADYGQLGNIKQAHFRTFSLGGGYGYTWSFWTHWFFHISASVAVGPQSQVYKTKDQGSFDRWSLAAKGLARTGFGAGGKKYFGGLSFIYDNTGFQIENHILNFSSNFSSLYFGMRFGI